MSKWYVVKKRKPKTEKHVLCFSDDSREIWIGYYTPREHRQKIAWIDKNDYIDGYDNNAGWHEVESSGICRDNVTHWQCLPRPPKE